MNSSAIFFFLTGVLCGQFSFGMEAPSKVVITSEPSPTGLFIKEHVSHNRGKQLGVFKALYDLLPAHGGELELLKKKVTQSADARMRVTYALVNCLSGFACLYEMMPTRLKQSNRAELFTKAIILLNEFKHEQAIELLKKAYRPIKASKGKLHFGLAGAALSDLLILKGEFDSAYEIIVPALKRHASDPYPVHGYLTQSLMILAYRSYHLRSQAYLRNNNHLIVILKEEKKAREERINNKKIRKVVEFLSNVKLKDDSSGVYTCVVSDDTAKDSLKIQALRREYFLLRERVLGVWPEGYHVCFDLYTHQPNVQKN